jgi:hypothetical protein
MLVAYDAKADRSTFDAVVPIIKGSGWIEAQRAYQIQQFGDDAGFGFCWEPYNSALVIVYAQFKEGIRFVRADEVGAGGVNLDVVRATAAANLRTRTKDLRIIGGDDKPLVICADGNLEPSLILIDELWDDLRVRVVGHRLGTIAERGFTLSCGSENPRHVWQLAADAAESYRKAQYPVSPFVFEQRGGRFEPLDNGDADAGHPIVDPDILDVHAVRRGGGSDLGVVIGSPLQADARSVYRLFLKLDGYLKFIASDAYREQCGPPSPNSTRIVVSINPESDLAVLSLLNDLGDWVASGHATLVVRTSELDSLQ